jgi:hypothetical protein
MKKPARRTKKVAKKSLMSTGKPAEQAEKKAPAVLSNVSTSWREEEELVDYEPETPPSSFPPSVEALSDPDDRPRTPVPGQADSSSPDYEFGVIEADDAPMAGQKRRPNFPEEEEQRRKAPEDESAASLRRGGKSVIPCKDGSVANLPGSASEGSKPTDDKDESAAPLRKGGKSVIPAKRDDHLANLPTSTLEGSKSSNQPDEGGGGRGRGGL